MEAWRISGKGGLFGTDSANSASQETRDGSSYYCQLNERYRPHQFLESSGKEKMGVEMEISYYGSEKQKCIL
jgi:hypothetical protein